MLLAPLVLVIFGEEGGVRWSFLREEDEKKRENGGFLREQAKTGFGRGKKLRSDF